MAEIFKFFNSAPGDERWHYASDFADYFGGVLSDGILHTDKQTDLGLRVRVVPNTLTTKVAAGKAIIKGYAYENTTELILKHDIPEPTLKRIDRIVLRLDLSNSSRYVKLFVKKGASATSPIAPTLQRDQYIHELSLAQVLVRENTTQLIETDLKDERMIESLCGLVSSIISVPTTQFQEQWDTWFESVKNEGFAPYADTGFKQNLKTTDKTTIVGAVNELKEDYVRSPGYATATGTNAYAVTLNPAPTSYKDGMGLVIKINTASTGATTINVNALGAKPILKANGAPVSDLKAGAVYSIRYNGTAFMLQGEGGDEKAIKTLLYNQTFNTTFGRLTYVDNDVLCYINSRICYKVSKTTGTLLKTIDTSSLQTSSWTLRSYTPDGFVLGNSGYTLYVYDELSTLLYSLPSSAYGGVHFYIANYGFYSTAYYNGNSISIGISRFNASQTYVGELYQLNVTSSSIINSVPLTVVKKQSGELHFVLNTTVNDLEYFRDILLTIATASKITDTTLANFKAISSAATKNLSSISVQEGWKQ
ncbi:hypothetical protein QN089_09200 [Kurthia sp. YJT4]|uniref:hypothetical protein n=1 Tax=Kurthia sp. YJT4 TaxID=3049086 RepID=UPI002550890C|nr:hypothetical protein [Kurthia sp. YJT4]WIL37532.1 hypothetical protein QN089_09200 [Kurthia sp. YJT4]